MIGLAFFKKLTKTDGEKRELFIDQFLSSPFHFWLKEEPFIVRNLLSLFELLPPFAIDYFLNGKPLTFVKSNGELSCALSSLEKQHVIIIFPELYKLLRASSSEHGLSVIAHEIGHLALGHSYKKISTIEAQIEADRFAASIGFGESLQNLLLDLPQNEETRIRITYLTSEIISQRYK